MDININRRQVNIETEKNQTNVDVGGRAIYENDHRRLSHRTDENQHPISAITGLEEALGNAGQVQDVKVDGTSVVDENGVANIPKGHIIVDYYDDLPEVSEELQAYVRYDDEYDNKKGTYRYNVDNTSWKYENSNIIENDGLGNQYLSDDGTYKIVPTQASDINAQPIKPNGTDNLIATDTGKVNTIYLPPASVGGLVNGGTFNSSGIITASTYCPELNGLNIDTISTATYVNFYFIATGTHSIEEEDYQDGDWAISTGTGWAKLNSSDAVTSVNGKLGTVVLNHTDVGASKEIVTETFTVTNWSALSGKSPFTASAVIVAQNLLNENTILSIAMDLLKQTTYGIGIGEVNTQTITLYAITTPTENLTIDLIMEE